MTDPLAYLFALDQFGIKFGLENIRAIVEAMGHPEHAFRSVHIAGTNGKGSVTAMVDTALRAAGHRTARYTSPHLIDLTERFVVDGRAIERDSLRDALGHVRAVVDNLLARGSLLTQPTFFEVTTAVAFELFRRAQVEIAVCEVGLGGRLDATNVLTPLATAITSIDFDHEQYLGSTLAEIAAEKAGIIKPGVPVVVGSLNDEALAVIRRVAEKSSAPVVLPISEATPRVDSEPPLGRARFHLQTTRRDYGEVTLSLPGIHQVSNALVAVELLELLDEAGIAVPPAAVVQGLTNVTWPARLDLRRRQDGREILLDAAHNPSGAAALAAFMTANGWVGAPLVFGAMRDKSIHHMLEPLLSVAGPLIITRASNARAADPEEVVAIARRIAPRHDCRTEPEVASALDAAWQRASRIVAAGSIFLLGDIVKELDEA